MKAQPLIALMSGLAVAACSVVGVRETKEPPFTVVAQVGAVEIRQYGARVAADTTVASDEMGARSTGFRRLAGYIFGGNTARATIAMTAPVSQAASQASETIAMTAPVATAKTADGWTIRFFMPEGSTLASLPVPNDKTVHLVAVPGQTVATLRFTGSTAPDAVRAKQDELLQALSGSAWAADGPVNAWLYDPPWTLPFLRRNEAVVAVTRR